MKRSILFLVLLISLTAAHAETCNSVPSGLKSKTDSAPDRESFLKIFGMRLGSRPTPQWTCFLEKISQGDESLSSALASMSKKPYFLAEPDVTEAISQALFVRPAFVLKIIGASTNPARTSEVICQVDTPYGVTKQKIDTTLAKVKASLSNVTDPSLNGLKQGCYESLDMHVREWKSLRQSAGAGDTDN